MIKPFKIRPIRKFWLMVLGIVVLGLSLLSTQIPTTVVAQASSDQSQAKISEIATWQRFLVDITDVIPDIPLDIRYFTDYNFIGRRIDGYNAPKCLLTPQAATALKRVQAELVPQGYSLKIYDCYRPQQAVDLFVLWAKDMADTKAQSLFYPSVKKQDLFSQGYIAEKSGHSRGSTVDLTIIPLNSNMSAPCQLGKNCKDNTIDMGSPFDFFDPLSHTLNSAISPAQQQNRLKLKTAMEKQGFKNLSEEWWHYTLKDESYPNTYFNFPIE
ncbi:MAG: M15 family metallopeptidase [Snowella sp.]|nr:M15 family metallopeptidase [Snowella sp.]